MLSRWYGISTDVSMLRAAAGSKLDFDPSHGIRNRMFVARSDVEIFGSIDVYTHILNFLRLDIAGFRSNGRKLCPLQVETLDFTAPRPNHMHPKSVTDMSVTLHV